MSYILALGYAHEDMTRKIYEYLCAETTWIIIIYSALFSSTLFFQGPIHIWSKCKSETALYEEMKPDKTATSGRKPNEFCVPSTCMQNN